jgi:multiple sugar transport system substrate-binding protein
MNKKRLTLLLVFCLIFSLVLAACNNSSNKESVKATGVTSKETSKPEEKVKLIFWDENAGPNRTPYYEELLKRFKEKNPNIDVEYVGISSSTNKQKYDAAIASNETPDVAGINEYWISDFVAKGALLPLDPFFDKWSDKDKIAPNLIAFNRTLAIDKKLYHIPNTMFMDVFWYRTDLIKAAGLNPPNSWGNFFTDVEKLTDISNSHYGYSIRGGGGSINQLTTAMYAYSGISSYFNSDGKSTVNDPKMIEFLKKYTALYKKNTLESDVSNSYKEMVANFNSGSAAIIQHNFGSYNDNVKALGKEKFAGALLPKAENGKRVVAPIANGYGIFKNTKNPDAAWKLLSFLESAESQTYWNQSIGQMPTNADSLNSDYVKNSVHLQEGSQVLNDKETVILNVPFYFPNYASIVTNQLEPDFQKVLFGKMTVEDFLNNWAKSLEKAKVDYDAASKK